MALFHAYWRHGLAAAMLLQMGSGLFAAPFDSHLVIEHPGTAKYGESESQYNFGLLLSASGTMAVVRAYPDGDSNGGRIHVIDLVSGDIIRVLQNPDPLSGNNFGESVSINGRYALIAAPYSDTGANNSGVVYVFDVLTGDLLREILNPSPGDFDLFGISVSLDGSVALIGAGNDDSIADNTGRAYLYDIQTGALLHTLDNPSPDVGDRFGWTVSLSAGRALVGAYLDDTNGMNAGRAYVFDAVSGALLHTLNGGSTPSALFGFDLSSDAETYLVGAYLDNSDGPGTGRAYLFDGETGTLVHTLENPAPAEVRNFGNSVAIDGGVAVVGALDEAFLVSVETGAILQTIETPVPAFEGLFAFSLDVANGRVIVSETNPGDLRPPRGYLHVFDAENGSLQRSVENPTGEVEHRFGSAVDIRGDYAIAGAPYFLGGSTTSGKAYVFDAVSGGLLHTLQNPATVPDDQFGAAVALGDSVAVVGAPGSDTSGSVAGATYAFDPATSLLLFSLPNPDPQTGAAFGRAVATDMNVIVVGAPGYDGPGAPNTGRVYVFDTATSALIRVIDNPAASPSDLFGSSVALSGGRLVVGAPRYSGILLSAGRAYVFDIATGDLETTLPNPTPAEFDEYGSAVAVLGATVVVAAPNASTAGVLGFGEAYLYDLATGTPPLTLEQPIPVNANFFAASIAVDSTTIAVGAVRDRLNGTGPADGVVHLFDRNTGAAIQSIGNPSADAFPEFGSAVSLDGDRAFFAASLDDSNGLNNGRAYLFASDSDTDGMADAWEVRYGLNPFSDVDSGGDSDSDSLSNLDEYLNKTLPSNPDTDADGLTDGNEVLNQGSNPRSVDTDGDGIDDGTEVDFIGTSPITAYSDADPLPDYWEALNWVGPLDAASGAANPDNDAYTNVEEYDNGTNPNSYDTRPGSDDDGDGIPDSYEVRFGLNPFDASDRDQDLDGDALVNIDEYLASTDANDPDTDDDGMPDGFEISFGLKPKRASDAADDPDGDGLSNLEEFQNNSSPVNDDTDADWIRDGYEVNVLGTNPASSDTDGDAMPDFWEGINFVGPTVFNPDDNPDGDPYTNLEEFQNGTNPNVADP